MSNKANHNIMTEIKITLLSLAILFFIGCDNPNEKADKQAPQEFVKKEYVPVTVIPETVTNITLNDSIRLVLKDRGRVIAAVTQKALKKELMKAVTEGGAVHAVSFCNVRAMEITDSSSLAETVKIRRIAKKFRNPLNEMDTNVANLYKGYILHWMNGGRPYATISWDDNGNPVYYYPINTGALCLNCHGKVGEEVKPEIAAKIAELYPNDQAMDFRLNDPRGLWEVTFPEYKVVAVD